MDLRDYLQIANQHKLLIAVVTLVAGAGSFFLSIRETPRYQASAAVLLTHQSLPSLLTNAPDPAAAVPPDRYAATQAQLARVPGVAALALATAHVSGTTPQDFLSDSSVAADPASDFLSFTFTAGDAATAERLATAYARAFVRYGYRVAVAPLRTAQRTLARRLERLRSGGDTGSALFRDLTERRQQLDALIALETPGARLVRAADSAAKTQPRPMQALAIGLPVGLVLGLVIALLIHLLDSRPRTVTAVEEALGLPSLGWVARQPRRLRHRVALLEQANGSYGEAIASVRTAVDLARRMHGGDAVLLTTIADRAQGVTQSVAANLAVATARTGQRVVLVELDLRQPTFVRLLGLEPRWGVTDVLRGAVDVEDALEPISIRPRVDTVVPFSVVESGGSLRVLPALGRPDNIPDVLASPGLGVLMERLRSCSDLLLVNAPPLLEGSDAAALSRHLDGAVVIAQIGRDRRDTLLDARRLLEVLPATALGFIGTGTRRPQTGRPRTPVAPPGRVGSEVLR